MAPVLDSSPPDELERLLRLEQLLARDGLDDDELVEFIEDYLEASARIDHPRFLAHQIAPPAPESSLADMVQGAINNHSTVFELGPSAIATEQASIRWMLEKVGWRSSGKGLLTHGGSLGNLTALLCARAQAAPEAWSEGVGRDLCIFAPDSVHYSIQRAAAILGLGERGVVKLPTDPVGRIDSSKLESTVTAAIAEGRRPVALVANAGATATGLYDDLSAVAAVCDEYGVWMHVDGAHGASALISSANRHLLAGIEHANSLVWDAHKMLRVSALCTGLLVREGEQLSNTFRQEANYLLPGESGHSELAAQSFESTRAALGLKLFLTIARSGESSLGAYVDRQYERAKSLHRRLQATGNFECPYFPDSNILCFRYGSSDTLQLSIQRHLLKHHDCSIGTTVFGGRRYLRACLMSQFTTDDTLDDLIDWVQEAALQPAAQ
ncbi:MAG: pyridoxal phosphate-dependent decarboxylase family protein [Solirubrobacterales bacterium]